MLENKKKLTQLLFLAFSFITYTVNAQLDQENCVTSAKIVTGYDGNNLISDYALDLNWYVIVDPAYPNSVPYPAIAKPKPYYWGDLNIDVNNDNILDSEKLIGPNPGYTRSQQTYVLTTEFCLSESTTSASIEIKCLADNSAQVYLNGNLIGGHTQGEILGFINPPISSTTTTAAFFNFGGKNVLSIVVFNEAHSSHNGTATGVSLFAAIDVVDGCILTGNQSCTDCEVALLPSSEKDYWLSAWVNVDTAQVKSYVIKADSAKNAHLEIDFVGQTAVSPLKLYPTGNIIDGWQRIVGKIDIPDSTTNLKLSLNADLYNDTYFDDIRIHPFNASMKSYVYDGSTFWLTSELDDNNYATFYEYDNEGGLIRIKKETERGIVTIQETRSSSAK